MSLENKLLSASIQSREAYDKIKDRIDQELSRPEAQLLMDLVGKFYSTDPKATAADTEFISAQIKLVYDSPKKVEEAQRLLGEAASTDVSIPNLTQLILESRKRDLAHKLAIAVTNNEKNVPELIEEYQRLEEAAYVDDEDEVLHNYSAEQSIAEVLDSRNLIRLPTKALTDAVDGGVTEGTHIVVVARPEIGKTALCLSFARVFSHQGLPGLYFGNEDPIKRIAVRGQSSFSGMAKEEIVANPKELDKRLALTHWDQMRLIAVHPGSPREVRRYVKMYKPKWIVVDQIRNLHVRADTRVNQLEAAATEMRNIAGEFNLVCVSVTQAGDSAEGKLTLGMGDVDFSNTGIPATADLMVMMGANEQYLQQGYRQINLPKNKISGNHTYFRVKINPQLSRIEDV